MNAFIFLSEDSSKTPILYLDNPQEVREFCKKNNISLDSYLDTNYNLTYSIENSNYSVCIVDINSQELKSFLNNCGWEFWNIVDFVTLSNKLNESDLLISIVYFGEMFIKDILNEYPKALKRFMRAIKMNYNTESAKTLIKLVFGESIDNQNLIKYIDIDAILNSLHVVENEDTIYLFNPKIK